MLFKLIGLCGCVFFSLAAEELARLRWGDTLEILNYVKPYLPSDPIIVEAGAYDGRESVQIAQFWPAGKLYAFEPVPELYQKLAANTEKHLNVKAFQKAVSDANGSALFYLSVDQSDKEHISCSSSLLQPKAHLDYAPYVLFPSAIHVETVTLDEWAKQQNIDHLDFLWLDMQGCELKALKASELVKKARAIWTEIEFVEAYEGQDLYKETLDWMQANGFKLIASNIDVEQPNYWFGDALFVKEPSSQLGWVERALEWIGWNGKK